MTAVAVESGNAEGVDILLKAGADVNGENHGQPAIGSVRTREMAIRLLEAGSDPGKLSFEGLRSLLGLEPDADEGLLNIHLSEFRNGRSRRFGPRNPEKMVEPFWEGKIRAGISAYQAHSYMGAGLMTRLSGAGNALDNLSPC